MLVTCRCYELRCQTGVVAGNYSSGNTLVPYAIAPSELKPVYQFQTVSNEPPADSFGRIFPGNVFNSSQLLFTDCWNTTDSMVWTLFLHLCGFCTAAGMRAGAGARSGQKCAELSSTHACIQGGMTFKTVLPALLHSQHACKPVGGDLLHCCNMALLCINVDATQPCLK